MKYLCGWKTTAHSITLDQNVRFGFVLRVIQGQLSWILGKHRDNDVLNVFVNGLIRISRHSITNHVGI